jgi:hypothetical protein
LLTIYKTPYEGCQEDQEDPQHQEDLEGLEGLEGLEDLADLEEPHPLQLFQQEGTYP